ncbi:hypothetical protein B0H19DRAFT_1184136, partial [Mycena capillaripes]
NGTKLGVDGSALRHTFAFGFGRVFSWHLFMPEPALTAIQQNLNTMSLLWAFDFKPALDANGNPVAPDIWAYGLHRHLIYMPMLILLFREPPMYRNLLCRITPRTSEKTRMIESEFPEAADGLSAEDRAFAAKSRVYGD